MLEKWYEKFKCYAKTHERVTRPPSSDTRYGEEDNISHRKHMVTGIESRLWTMELYIWAKCQKGMEGESLANRFVSLLKVLYC